MSGLLRVLFVAYVAATLAHIGLVMAHEPFAFDAWNVAFDTHAEPFSFSRFAAYWADQYTHSNPRVGQAFTYLAYKLVWFAPIATPLAFLSVAAAVVTIGTGRLPSWRRGGDLALFAIALGFAWFALPSIGMIMFCRAYGANYLYGAAIQLWFLVPLRLSAGRTSLVGWPVVIAYAVFGLVAGACNEHTGPTLCLFLIGLAAVRYWRAQPARLERGGALGAAVGFALIFFAPGQNHRYEDLAQRVSLVGRLLGRGFSGNLDILREFWTAATPVLCLTVLALAIAHAQRDDAAPRRAALRLLAAGLVAGTLIAATLFVSPKLGPRFYVLGGALVLAGFIAVADAALERRQLAPFVVLAVAASIYAGVRTIPLFLHLDRASDARLAMLAATTPGSSPTVDSWEQVDPSWWFLGDDFRDPKKRELVSDYYDLAGLVFRGVDIEAPLGVSDVRLVPRVRATPAACADDLGGLELTGYRPTDVAQIQAAFGLAVASLRARLPATTRVDEITLDVTFAGTPPLLPRPRLVVARWTADARGGAGSTEQWAASIQRRSGSTLREIKVPPALAATGREIYIYNPGGEAHRLGLAGDAELTYTPWKTGAYWVLACGRDDCFVIAFARQAG